MSTTSESQPIFAMTSADQLEGMPHQLLTTALPSAQISRTRFARAIKSSIAPALNEPIPPASGAEVKRPGPSAIRHLSGGQGGRHIAAEGVKDRDRRQRVDDGGGHHRVPCRVGVFEQ